MKNRTGPQDTAASYFFPCDSPARGSPHFGRAGFVSVRRALVLAIKGYKLLISPFLPPSCIYHPTCSNYAAEALQKHGVFKGAWLAVKRVLRCNPLSKGGFDAVP